jgi:hypothetical protein
VRHTVRECHLHVDAVKACGLVDLLQVVNDGNVVAREPGDREASVV